MKNMWVIIKKELRRFFTDKRMMMSLILPGIMIYFIYSLMGSSLSKITDVNDDYKYLIASNVEVEVLKNLDSLDFKNLEFIDISDLNEEEIFDKITNKEIDLYLVLEDDFFESIENKTSVPTVKLFYNSTKNESNIAFQIFASAFSKYESDRLENILLINPPGVNPDLATEESKSIMIIAMMVPFLLITFLFTGAMSISIESIAGEKERGTIATLLATPTKRINISMGKIISLSIVSLISAASSFIGLIVSLPKLLGDMEIETNMYNIGTYLLLFAVIITTVLLFVVMISLVSAYAKSIKEATSLASVIMIFNVLISVTSMTGKSSQNIGTYFIPIYNSISSISSILSLEFNSINFLVTILTNLFFTGIGTYLLTKMFNSERIMFNK